MNDSEIRKIAQDEIQKYATNSQFGVVPIPYHAHTGVDSPQIAISDTTGFTDASWGLFRWTTLFESIDGYTQTITAGSIVADGEKIRLSTGAVMDDITSLLKQPTVQDIMNFDHLNRFRTTFQLGLVSNQTIYIVVGSVDEDYYGFKITNATLIADSVASSGETTINIATLSALTDYDLEARFYPHNRIDYFLNGVYKATITTNLPNSADVLRVYPMDVYIKTNNGTAKTIDLSYWDFLQESNLALR